MYCDMSNFYTFISFPFLAQLQEDEDASEETAVDKRSGCFIEQFAFLAFLYFFDHFFLSLSLSFPLPFFPSPFLSLILYRRLHCTLATFHLSFRHAVCACVTMYVRVFLFVVCMSSTISLQSLFYFSFS